MRLPQLLLARPRGKALGEADVRYLRSAAFLTDRRNNSHHPKLANRRAVSLGRFSLLFSGGIARERTVGGPFPRGRSNQHAAIAEGEYQNKVSAGALTNPGNLLRRSRWEEECTSQDLARDSVS